MRAKGEAQAVAAPLVSDTFSKTDSLLVAQRWIIAAVVVVAGFGVGSGLVDRFSLLRATLYGAAVVLLVACSVLRGMWQRRIVVPRSWSLAPLLVFVGVLTIAAVTSAHPMRAFIGPYTRYTGVAMYLTYVALFAFVLRCHNAGTARQIVNLAAWTLGLIAAYGLMQFAGLDPIAWPESQAESGFELPTEFATFGNVNFASGFVGTLAPCAAWIAVDRRRDSWQRIAGAAAFGAAALYLVLLGSAQGLVAFGLGAAFFGVVVIVERRNDWLQRSRGLRRGIIGAAAVLGFLAVPILQRIATDQLNDAGTRERRQLWGTAVDLWLERPVLGFGPGSFERLFPTNRPEAHAVQNNFLQADSPHNVPLDFALSGGALLVAAYLVFVVFTGASLLSGLRRTSGEQRLLLGALGAAWLGYHGQSLFSIDVPSVAVLHWILAAAVLVVARAPRAATLSFGAPAPTAKGGRPGRGRTAARRQSSGSWVGVAVAVTACVVVIWLVARPLRADRASFLAAGELAAGDRPGALFHTSRAVDLAPWEARYRAQLASVYDGLGQTAEAIEAGKAASARAPGSSFYALAVAGLAVRSDDPGLARVWLAEALERDPHNPEVRSAVAETRTLLQHGADG